MAGPLLDTKLYAPASRRSLVARPELTARLGQGTQSKLTLISAPAGFGKTTLLAEWLAGAPAGERATGWVSLDEADNDAVTFWSYVIAALQSAAPGIGAGTLSLLNAPQPQALEGGIAVLLNELGALAGDIVLVLDDYHEIHSRDVHGQVTYLLEHLPPQAHVVISTRADPALPLARLRARGELTEIRATDLRFTPDEAAAYLNELMGLDLAAGDVAALETRTEGWIAALQLAALSMQGRGDVGRFIADFAGDDRYIVDYLTEEVLQRQPEMVRDFLLQTSILSRLSGPLCDAVTGGDRGRQVLEALDRGNLFLVPLDDRRQWYRYHQLFADVLQARLMDEQPDRVHELHRRAAEWHERHRHRSDAIRHAIAGEDFERAADLVELALPSLRQARELATIRSWLQALPERVLRVRPVLSVAYAGALMANGEIEDVEARLRDAERWLDTAADTGEAETGTRAMFVADEEAMRRLPATIAIYRTAQAQASGNQAAAVTHARRALELAGDDDHFERGAAAGFLALVHWGSGDLETAYRRWTDTMASLRKAGHVVDAIGCIRPLAEIRIAQGRLRQAMRLYEQGWRMATEGGALVQRGAADMQVGMSELRFEWDDLAGATQHLLRSSELGEHAGLALNPYRWRTAMARIRHAEGDHAAALELLDEAQRVYVSEFYPDVRPVAAMTARIWISQARLAEARAWASDHGVSTDDDLSYIREFEHITLARLLMARSRLGGDEPALHDALSLLARLLAAAEEGGRTGSAIEILVLQSIAHRASGDLAAALASLERALALAEPEGYVRVFAAEGAAIGPLLSAAAKASIAPEYVGRLLAELGGSDGRRHARQALVEPLSERELEVLRLLASDLDGPAIAAELVVALSTVRSHTKSIYAKLGVSNRRAAVRRGDELGLLSRAARR